MYAGTRREDIHMVVIIGCLTHNNISIKLCSLTISYTFRTKIYAQYKPKTNLWPTKTYACTL